MSKLFSQAVRGTSVLEEDSSGKTNREREHTLYGHICDFAQLSEHPWEDHEQWEIKLPKNSETQCEGRQRVRKTTTPDGQVQYVQTLKVSDNGRTDGEDETSVAVTEDVFNQFKRMAAVGMLKRRYMVPIQGRDKPWEFDVFPNEEGGWHPQCKIDLEVPDLGAALPPMPLTIADLITAPEGERSKDEEQRVRQMYGSVFRKSRDQIEKINAQRSAVDK